MQQQPSSVNRINHQHHQHHQSFRWWQRYYASLLLQKQTHHPNRIPEPNAFKTTKSKIRRSTGIRERMSWKTQQKVLEDNSSDDDSSDDGVTKQLIQPSSVKTDSTKSAYSSKWNARNLPSETSSSSSDSDNEEDGMPSVNRVDPQKVDSAKARDIPIEKEKSQVTQLLVASASGDMDSVAELIECGTDINSRGDMDLTALHVATIGGKLKMVQWLVVRGACLSNRTTAGMTPLHFACEYSFTPIAIYLIRMGADVTSGNKNNLSPLHYICITGNMKLAPQIPQHMINATAKGSLSLLHCSADMGSVDMVRYLLDHRAEVSVQNAKGLTPLHLAAWRGHVAVMHALVAHGRAYWNVRDKSGASPFLLACRAGQLAAVGYLIECGCTVDARTDAGDTAFHLTCLSGTQEALELIFNLVPELINCRNYAGKTPCDICAANSQGQLQSWLQDRGGLRADDLSSESEEDRTARLEREREEECARRCLEAEELTGGFQPPDEMPTE